MTETEREIKINDCWIQIRKLIEDGNGDAAMRVFNQAVRLIRMRSDEQIERMERERGLV